LGPNEGILFPLELVVKTRKRDPAGATPLYFARVLATFYRLLSKPTVYSELRQT